MTDQQIPAPHEVVAERMETRRAALQLRMPLALEGSGSCDGWGAVPGLDGEREPAACGGCALCGTVRPARRQRDPFARLPVVASDDELEM